MKSYISLLEQYEIIPAEERALYDRKVAQVAAFAKRRELKIAQYKKEKDLVAKIQVTSFFVYLYALRRTDARMQTIRKRRGQAQATDDTPTDYELISSLLPSSIKAKEDEELDSETDEILRETTLLLLRLLYVHASTQLQSSEIELELLRNAPPSPTMTPVIEDERDKKRKADDDAWKLDIPVAGGPDGKGPLMDPSGKV